MLEHDTGKLCKSDGEQCKIDAAHRETESECADDDSQHGGNERRREHREPGRQTVTLGKNCEHISSDAKVKRMPKRELAGKSHHQVPGNADERCQEHEGKNAEEKIAERERQSGQRCSENRGGDYLAVGDRLDHCVNRREASKPAGRTSSTMISRA